MNDDFLRFVGNRDLFFALRARPFLACVFITDGKSGEATGASNLDWHRLQNQRVERLSPHVLR
jgi:hypothetical protein